MEPIMSEAAAKRAVLAVKCHDDMLAALKLCLPLLEREFLYMAHSGTPERRAIDAGRTAIAKATGGGQ